MWFSLPDGFGTVSSSLLALPAHDARQEAVWLFASGAGRLRGFELVPF